VPKNTAPGNAPKMLHINNENSKTVSGKYKARCQKSATLNFHECWMHHYPINHFGHVFTVAGNAD
jgi:hypothetical protein